MLLLFRFVYTVRRVRCACVCEVMLYMRWIVLYQKISVYRFSINFILVKCYPVHTEYVYNIRKRIRLHTNEQREREKEKGRMNNVTHVYFFVIHKLAQ